jgi:very-short-patch-repair endonuclease
MQAGRGAVKRLNPVAPELRDFAKGQRSQMTRAEALFWQQVRGKRLDGLKFKRQVPIGPYVVDFLCAARRLIVELDGRPHEATERLRRDRERDAWLKGQGFIVLRFSNDLALGGMDLLLQGIREALRAHDGPSPGCLRQPPSPAKGGGSRAADTAP